MIPFKVIIDEANDRMRVTEYQTEAAISLINHIKKLEKEQSVGKLIVVAHEQDLPRFKALGFKIEAMNGGYYRGRPGYFLTKYNEKARGVSSAILEEDLLLNSVLQKPVDMHACTLPEGYILRNATCADTEQLSRLFAAVFSSYPTPIFERDYLESLIHKYPFKVIVHHDTIVCAASAEVDTSLLSAELTDCACMPEHRSRGLNSCIMLALEQDLRQQGVKNLYSIARARSAGINTILNKLGYIYGGRLINNCHICGQFEDMNLWYKNVKC